MMAAVCMIAGFTAGRSFAAIIYNLVDVTLVSGNKSAGTLTGSLTTNDDLTALLAVDITVSIANINKVAVFKEDEYTLSNSASSSLSLNQLRIEIAGGSWLLLDFTNGLSTTGALLHPNSSQEHQNGAGNRKVASGSIVGSPVGPVAAVPEPGALALIAIGIPAVLGGARGVAARRLSRDVASLTAGLSERHCATGRGSRDFPKKTRFRTAKQGHDQFDRGPVFCFARPTRARFTCRRLRQQLLADAAVVFIADKALSQALVGEGEAEAEGLDVEVRQLRDDGP